MVLEQLQKRKNREFCPGDQPELERARNGSSCLSPWPACCPPALEVLLLLFLLHSGQHVAFTDGCDDPGNINDTLVIECCPSDGANITVNLSSGELPVRIWACTNSTSPCPGGSQCAACEVENSTLPLSNMSSCMSAEPVKDRTNHSVALHWQNPSDWCTAANVTANISGLFAGQNYNMTVYRVSNGLCSQGKSICVATKPSPVLKVEIESRTVNSLEISWTAPEDRHKETYTYEVCLSNVSSRHNCSILARSPWNANELEAGVTYRVTVCAIANNISSVPTYRDATTVPNRPSNVSVNGTSDNTHNLSISWVPPKDPNAANYLYWVSWAHENNTGLRDKSTNGTSYILDGLLPGNLYLVNLSSWISGVSSANVTEWALAAPLPPTNFSITTINQSAAALSWKPPDSSFSSFELYWQKMSMEPGENKTFWRSDRTGLQVNGLTPGTNYTFVVVSVVTRKNQTMRSTQVQQEKSTKPARVGNVECLSLKWGYSLKVSWTYPQHYGVTKFQVSGFGCAIDTQRNMSVMVNNLHPARSYQIEVATFWYDQQEKSNPVMCSTDDAGVVIGALGLVLLLLVILGLLLFYFRRRGKNILGKLKTAEESPSRVVASIPVSAFPCYCLEHLSDSAFGFAQEYQQLQDVGTGQPWSVAQRPENQGKNRYNNVLPYDSSRVLLTPKPGDPNSDYINASYLPGYKSAKEFIAAQGPLPGTLHDFWHMIWEQRVTTLVMLTKCVENGRVKCEHYWPLDYTPCVYDNITVSVVTETILPDWTIRDFRMKKVNSNQTNESEVRLARHYHYTSWPDHQVPQVTSTILRFRELVREHIEQQEGSRPVLVHCSAGVGRTGTFIALDSLLRQAQNEGEMGVFAFVQRMRMNRPLMIQTESQYIFLHQCLLDGIRPGPQNDSEKLECTAVYENIMALQGYEVTRV